jgi:hypothetical protein
LNAPPLEVNFVELLLKPDIGLYHFAGIKPMAEVMKIAILKMLVAGLD